MKNHKAYRAMFHFLDDRYKRLPSDDLGGLLGELSFQLWADGTPNDPAITQEWEQALEKAENESDSDLGVRLRKAS